MKIFNWSKNIIPQKPTNSQEASVKFDDKELKNQQEMAEEFYIKNPEIALNIALGLEKAPEGILASAIYAKVCVIAEKTGDTETSMKLANSLHNSRISAEAQRLNFRRSDSPIEIAKDVVNARIETVEKTLPEGKTIEGLINEGVEIIEKEISKTKLTKKDAAEVMEDFVDSIKEHTSQTINMTIDEADKVVSIWGKYLEYCSGRFNMIFLHNKGKIPESLLPFPKLVLEDALNIMDKHYFDTGNKRGMELMRATMVELVLYEDDEKALQNAGESLSDPEKRKRIVTAIKDWQRTWLTTQGYDLPDQLLGEKE